MRAAIVMAEVLKQAPEGLGELRRLDDAGVTPVVLATGTSDVDPAVDTGGFPTLTCDLSPPACWDDGQELLADAAALVSASVHEAFLICGDASVAGHGAATGCRSMLVLGDRLLQDVTGDEEPSAKHAPTAQDLATVVTYAIDEAAQEAAVGPFPFGPALTLDRPVRSVGPSPKEIAMIFAVVIIAGVTMALGIAYLLQEAYQTVRFPPVAYWVTLQFIPQTWRGVLFLGFGLALGFLASRILSRMTGRRRSGL